VRNIRANNQLEKLDIKLAKNRESARNSRIRKKVYIDLLEKTVDKLQRELAETKKQLEQYINNSNKISFQPKPVII
jgi:predicted RNase H-like nuclease (RuvC/YqgF family)